MAYREYRTYQGGKRLALQHQTGGIWSIDGAGIRASTPPGTTREVAHRRADIIAGADPVSAWTVDDGAIVVGDGAPCHHSGCAGHYTFERADGSIVGRCSADAGHVYVAR